MASPQPTFFKLTKDIWLAAIHELKPSDIKVLFYMLTLKPLQDSWFELEIATIAQDLEIHTATVYKALRRLKVEGLIDLEVTHVRVRVTDKGRGFSQMANPSPNGENFRQTAKTFAKRRKNSPNGEKIRQTAKIEAGNDCTEDVSDPLRSIRSNRLIRKRERGDLTQDFPQAGAITPEYRDWLLRKAESLPKRPTFIESWVDAQSQNPTVFAEYEAWCKGQNVPPPVVADANFESQADYWAFVNGRGRTGQ